MTARRAKAVDSLPFGAKVLVTEVGNLAAAVESLLEAMRRRDDEIAALQACVMVLEDSVVVLRDQVRSLQSERPRWKEPRDPYVLPPVPPSSKAHVAGAE